MITHHTVYSPKGHKKAEDDSPIVFKCVSLSSLQFTLHISTDSTSLFVCVFVCVRPFAHYNLKDKGLCFALQLIWWIFVIALRRETLLNYSFLSRFPFFEMQITSKFTHFLSFQ